MGKILTREEDVCRLSRFDFRVTSFDVSYQNENLRKVIVLGFGEHSFFQFCKQAVYIVQNCEFYL